jgi:membrane-bound ClpP family serine protease
MSLMWVVLLLVLGLAVMVAEVFVPSGGVLGFVSIMAILAAVTLAFLQVGPGAGVMTLAVVMVSVPTVLGLAFRWFPETALGRRVLPPPPEGTEVVPQAAERQRLRDLVGQSGDAVTDLLPWGTVALGSERVEGMSDAGPLTAGSRVRVVGVQGLAVIVRPVGSASAERHGAHGPDESAPPPGDRLSPTLETFEFDQFDPPPA